MAVSALLVALGDLAGMSSAIDSRKIAAKLAVKLAKRSGEPLDANEVIRNADKLYNFIEYGKTEQVRQSHRRKPV